MKISEMNDSVIDSMAESCVQQSAAMEKKWSCESHNGGFDNLDQLIDNFDRVRAEKRDEIGALLDVAKKIV